MSQSLPSNSAGLPSYLKASGNELHLAIKVVPRSSRNEICGCLGEALKVKVTAPPIDSAANEAVLRLLAEQLGCSRSALRLVRGQASRLKHIGITGQSCSEVVRCLQGAENKS